MLLKRAQTAFVLVKGSHIVVPQIHDLPEHAYILQNEDRSYRICLAI